MDKLTYLMCQTSASHTYGNLTAFIQNMIIKQFPDKFFNTVHVSSKIAHRQLISTGKQFLRKTKPIFIIRPRVDWDKSDTFLNGSLLTNPSNMVYASWGDTNLQDFMYDADKEYTVKWLMNRDVMYFDVILIFSTMMEQMNWAKNIEHIFQKQRPFTLSTCLESFIPEQMMEVISKCAQIPIKDTSGSITPFMNYVNKHSLYPITYKLQGSTQTHEFYRYYPVQIDTVMTDMNVADGVKNGHIISDYNISFSLRCEFNTTGYYYIFSEMINEMDRIKYSDNATLIPIYTDIIMDKYAELPQGWIMYNTPSVMLTDNNTDTVDISPVLNASLKECIRQHVEDGLPLSLFIDIKVREQGEPLATTKYDIDYKNAIVTFKNCSTYYTYKLLIMIDIGYINNFIKERFNLK